MTSVESRKRKVRFSSTFEDEEDNNEELPTDDEVKEEEEDDRSIELPEKKIKVDEIKKPNGKEEASQSQCSEQSQIILPREDDLKLNVEDDKKNNSKGIIKKFLCPHRQFGCLFETMEKKLVNEHMKQCLYEEFKEYLQDKESQIKVLQQQLDQSKKEMKWKLNMMEQQMVQLGNSTFQLMAKVQQQESIRHVITISNNTSNPGIPSSTATPLINPKYLKNPAKGKSVQIQYKSQASAQLLRSLEGHSQIVTTLSCHDKYLFSGSGDSTRTGSLKCWDLSNFNLVKTISDDIVFSSTTYEGRLIVGCMHNIKIFDMDSMELFYTLEGHKGEVKAVCMAGKYLLSGAVDGFLKVWDFENLRCTLSIPAHENQVIGIECILKGFDVLYVFTASHDATIKMWDSSFKHVHTFKGHLAPVRALIRIEDCILSGGEDNQIKVWNWVHKKEVESINGIPGVTALKSGRFNGNSIFLSGHVNGLLLIWDFKGREVLQIIEAHKDRVRSIYGHNKLLLTSSYDKTIKIWQ